MANGRQAHYGAVAGPVHGWPLGTRLLLSERPPGVPAVVTVEDHIGWGSSLDFALPGDCRAAREWGRRVVVVEVLDG